MNQIKRYRKKKSFSQAEFGKMVGLSQAQIARLEQNQLELTIEKMKIFAEILKVEPWQLLPEDMQPSFYHDLALQMDYGTMIYNEALQLHKQNKKVMDLVLQQAKVTNKFLEKYNKWVANEQD